MERIGRVRITRVEEKRVEDAEDVLVLEREITIYVNEERMLLTSYSPGHERELVYGFLFSEGIIAAAEEVTSIESKEEGIFVQLEEGPRFDGDRPPFCVKSPFTISVERLLDAARNGLERAGIFRKTGGTHAASLGGAIDSINFFEDVSRTCSLEKALGDALLRGIDFGSTFLFITSRISHRMVQKATRCGVPVFAAVSAPTLQAVEAAKALNMCLCGFVRDERLNVYTHGWRIGL